MGMTRSQVFRAAIAISSVGLFFVVGVAVLCLTADSHNSNYKYLLWKHGYREFDPAIACRYLHVDSDFRMSLIGKTKDEMRAVFPILKDRALSNEYQQHYNQFLESQDALWIGESNWAAIFQNEKLVEIQLLKG